jgi:hypothetical protein
VFRSAIASAGISGAPVHGADPALSANGRYLAFTTSARDTHNGVDGLDTECDPGQDPSGPDPSPSPSPGPDPSPSPSPSPSPGPDPGPGPGPGGPGSGLGLRLSIDLDLEADINPLIYLDVDIEIDLSLGLDLSGLDLSGLGLDIGLGHGDSSAQPSRPQPQPQPVDPAAVSHCDVVVRDLVLDSARAAANLPRLPAELASPSLTRDCVDELPATDTCEGDDASGYPALSADGGVVAYESEAATLVPEDRNGRVQDVFARTFAPRLVADPLDFFTIEPGSSTSGSAAPRHEGFGPLVVESLIITGPNATDFTVTAQTCVGRTLQGGESCLVTVRFSPSEVGPRRAVLEIRYRGTGSPLPIPLSGIGDQQPPRAFTSVPEPLSFGAHLPLSTSPPGEVTVRNTGAAPMTVSAVSIPADVGAGQFPRDYTIIADNCTGRTLQPGETCTVTLQYSPQGVGPRPAVLRFDDNAPNGPHLVALQGSGIVPLLRFNPAVVQEGRVTSLFGSGFAPLRTVTVRLPDRPAPIVVTTDAAGNFTTPVVVYPNSTPGERIAEATVDAHEPPITATAGVLIVPGTVSPPDFHNRR